MRLIQGPAGYAGTGETGGSLSHPKLRKGPRSSSLTLGSPNRRPEAVG